MLALSKPFRLVHFIELSFKWSTNRFLSKVVLKKIYSYRLVNIYLSILLFFLFTSSAVAQHLSFNQAVDSALKFNKLVQSAALSVQVQQEKHKDALGMLLPQLSASAEYKYFTDLPTNLMPQSAFGGPVGDFREVQFGVPHNIQAAVLLQLPLYQPQVWGAIRSTSIAEELSELQLEKTKEQIYVETANAYRQAQLLAQQIGITQTNLSNTKTLERLTRLVHEQGLAKATDLDQVHLQVLQVQDALLQLEQAHKQVLTLLKVQLGWTNDRELTLDSQIVEAREISQETKPSIDWRLSETHKSFLKSELSTIKWTRLPSVSLFGSFGTTGFGYNESPNEFLDFYPISFVGIKTQVNLFSGLSSVRKSTQKKVEIKQVQLQQEQLVDVQFAKLQNARFSYNLAQSQLNTAKEHIKLAETVYKQTQLEFEQGVSALRDVLLADSALQKTQQTYFQHLVNLVKAELEINHLSGNLLGESL